MTFSRFLLGVFATALTAAAGTLTAPIGLNPGDHYRLVFVTATTRNAASANIADYDSFVNTAANGGSSVLAGFGTTWLAIGSTATVNAITHIGLGSVPIYGVNGVRIANNSSDFWDGSLIAPISFDNTGSSSSNLVFTGTGTSGSSSSPLGATAVNYGQSSLATSSWIAANSAFSGLNLPFYGISSGDLVVPGSPVPEPGTWGVVLAGLLGAYAARRNMHSRVD